MENIQYLEKLWPLIVSLVLVVAWLIRLESKVLYMEKDSLKTAAENSKREEGMWKKFDEVNNKLTEALKTLSKIEGRLEGHNRSDT